MKDRPIIFSAPMVRAILEGRKTQTRRVVKPQPEREPSDPSGLWYPSTTSKRKRHYANESHFVRGLPLDWCPYGAPGDRLWVKHAHWYKRASDLTPEIIWSPESPHAVHRDHKGVWVSSIASSQYDIDQHGGFKKRPSIHMPRWASRLTLEVVSVRVERLQAISEEDAKAEGATPAWCSADSISSGSPDAFRRYRDGLKSLWESINGNGSWADNPWVWVIEFKRIDNTTAAHAAKED